MADPEQVTERLDEFLSRPSTLLDLCEEAGKGRTDYRRVQQALRRWREEEGRPGLSEEDAEWVQDVLLEVK